LRQTVGEGRGHGERAEQVSLQFEAQARGVGVQNRTDACDAGVVHHDAHVLRDLGGAVHGVGVRDIEPERDQAGIDDGDRAGSRAAA
jgi:hypothetical protein